MNKEKIESGINFAYKNRSISMLENYKQQAVSAGYYDLVGQAVRYINSLQNPFIIFC